MEQDLPLFPEAASTAAHGVDRLFVYAVAVAAFFALLVSVLVIGFAARYRRREGREAVPIHGSRGLEILWTAVPLAFVTSCFWWGASLYFRNLRPPADAMRIDVTGKQWMWKLQHSTGQREINELHVPIGVPVELRMISEDVIHSFYVPAFRIKLDVLPGRYSTTWFEAARAGAYHLFCAEYCGTRHSHMRGWVVAMEPGDYERWLAASTPEASPREAGRTLFAALRCDTCHSATSGARGPPLAGRFGTEVGLEGGGTAVFDAGYVRESLLDPRRRLARGFQPLMPTYAGQLDEGEILALVAYLESPEPSGGGE